MRFSAMGIKQEKFFARGRPYFRRLLTRETRSFTSLFLETGAQTVFAGFNEPVDQGARVFILTWDRKNFCEGFPIFLGNANP